MFCVAVHLLLQQVSEEQSYCKSVVKKQQQQAQLRKLPRHHPLIREVHSDNGMQLSTMYLCYSFYSVAITIF